MLLSDSLATEGQGRVVIAHTDNHAWKNVVPFQRFGGCAVYIQIGRASQPASVHLPATFGPGSGGLWLKDKGMGCLGRARSDRHYSLTSRNRLKEEFSSGQIPAVAKFLGPRREQVTKYF